MSTYSEMERDHGGSLRRGAGRKLQCMAMTAMVEDASWNICYQLVPHVPSAGTTCVTH